MSVVAAKHSIYQYRTTTGSPYLINNVALSVPEVDRTLTLSVASPFIPNQPPQVCYDKVTLSVLLPNPTGGSTFSAVLSASLDGGVTYGGVQQQVVDTITSDLTITNFRVNKSIGGGGPEQFTFFIPIHGYTHLRVLFSSTATTDLISVQATATTT